MSSSKKKLAIVVQRCGENIYGGAEQNALMLARNLTSLGWTIDILTSQAADYRTWQNKLSPYENLNGIHIYRFKSKTPRLQILMLLVQKGLYRFRRHLPFLYFPIFSHFDFLFLLLQGPWCPDLWKTLKQKVLANEYSGLIFMTYLYAPTYYSLKALKNTPVPKILMPTAHDEEPFYLSYVGKSFDWTTKLACISRTEKQLLEKIWKTPTHRFTKETPPGVDHILKQESKSAAESPIMKTLPEKFFCWVGRNDPGKGFYVLEKLLNPEHHVVVIGAGFDGYSHDPRFTFLGSVDDSLKIQIIKRSMAMLVTSQLESYSMVTAEAMALNCPVISVGAGDAVNELIDDYNGLKIPIEDLNLTLANCHKEEFRSKFMPMRDKIILEKSWLSTAKTIEAAILQQ